MFKHCIFTLCFLFTLSLWVEFCFVLLLMPYFPLCYLGNTFFNCSLIVTLAITLCILDSFESNINYLHHIPTTQGSQIQFPCFLPFMLLQCILILDLIGPLLLLYSQHSCQFSPHVYSSCCFTSLPAFLTFHLGLFISFWRTLFHISFTVLFWCWGFFWSENVFNFISFK